MTCGVYLLQFPNTSKVYIGQSKTIETRFRGHLTKLSNSASPKKLQGAYNTYGNPTLHILETCQVEQLDTLENSYIKQYNSVEQGFNTLYFTTGGQRALYGETSPNASSTNDIYIEAFKLLLTDKTIQSIADETGLTKSIIQHIASLESHTWIQVLYPEEYNILISKVGSRGNNKHVVYPIIYSPSGEQHLILGSVTAFAQKNKLDASALLKVLKGQMSKTSGWSLQPLKKYSFKDPHGKVHSISEVSKFIKDNSLDQSSVSRLISGKAKSHKGWTLVK